MTETKEERALSAAREVFMRYGFRRTTMGDLADAAQMSRPALYLIYSSKEDIFRALLAQVFDEMLTEIRTGLGARAGVEERLALAFEVWCVQPFAMVQAAPDAKDILESGDDFAPVEFGRAFADFERIIADTLRPLMGAETAHDDAPDRLAHILTAAAHGLKEVATSVVELRELIASLITVFVAGVRAPTPGPSPAGGRGA